MRHGHCAASGALIAALLIGGAGVGRIQAQAPPNSIQPDFDTRFYFQNDNPPAEAGTAGIAHPERAPLVQESQPSRNPLKALLVSPAEAAPSPSPDTSVAAQPKQEMETAQTPPLPPEKPAERPAAAAKPLLPKSAPD